MTSRAFSQELMAFLSTLKQELVETATTFSTPVGEWSGSRFPRNQVYMSCQDHAHCNAAPKTSIQKSP